MGFLNFLTEKVGARTTKWTFFLKKKFKNAQTRRQKIRKIFLDRLGKRKKSQGTRF